MLASHECGLKGGDIRQYETGFSQKRKRSSTGSWLVMIVSDACKGEEIQACGARKLAYLIGKEKRRKPGGECWRTKTKLNGEDKESRGCCIQLYLSPEKVVVDEQSVQPVGCVLLLGVGDVYLQNVTRTAQEKMCDAKGGYQPRVSRRELGRQHCVR